MKDNTQSSMVGWYFVTADDKKEILNQGVVVQELPQFQSLLVLLFSWFTGGPGGYYIVSIKDAQKYLHFTGTKEQHEEICEREKKIYRPAFNVADHEAFIAKG
jgi:hypothetical protein